MALAPVTASSNPRRAKPFAIRTFPSFCGPAASSSALLETPVAINADQKSQPSPLITPPEPTSCGPETSFLSYRGKSFKLPIAFAIRKFPKGCGPIASVRKSSDKASIVVARRVSVEGNGAKFDVSSSMTADCVVKGEDMEFGGMDGEKRYGDGSNAPDFVKDGDSLCRAEGSENDNKIEEIEEKLTDILRRTSNEGSRLGKGLKKSAVGKSLGGKNGEKPDGKSSLAPDRVKSGGKFSRPERSETMIKDENMKEKLNNDWRRIGNEKNGIGKVLKSDVVGKSLSEKDDTKPNRKRSLAPDRSEDGELLEVRGDRLIVLALMASNRCPWMQGKGKGSVVLQSTPKKQESRPAAEPMV